MSWSRQQKVALCALAIALLDYDAKTRREKVRRIRRHRGKPRIQQREAQGACRSLCCELEAADEIDDFTNFARVFPDQFHTLEQLVTPIIRRRNTNFRDCISVGERLTVTLRFLATGESFTSLAYLFHMGVSTIRQFIPETCKAIYQVLRDKYMKCPDSAQEWREVASGFETQWNFPNCIGALDGKHINTRPLPGPGSTSDIDKHTSIVLMGLVDSCYRFLYVDVGCNGKISDGGVFHGLTMFDALDTRRANIPGPTPLPGTDQMAPHCIVADKAFPLKDYMMKPYLYRGLSREQRVFNYRLSRAHGVVENAFGILTNHFRVLKTTINIQDTSKVEDVVLACCALHNFLCVESGDMYMSDMVDREGPDMTIVPGRWREGTDLKQAPLPRGTNFCTRAKLTRDELCAYFVSDAGSVPFQYDRM